MPLTHDFREIVQTRAQRDPAFRHALLGEALQCRLNGERSIAEALLRDYFPSDMGTRNRSADPSAEAKRAADE